MNMRSRAHGNHLGPAPSICAIDYREFNGKQKEVYNFQINKPSHHQERTDDRMARVC